MKKSIHQRVQKKIIKKSIEMMVLQLLSQFQTTGDCIDWKAETISQQLRMDKGGVSLALMNLLKSGYVRRIKSQWFITTEGREEFTNICKNISFQNGKSEFQFRNEVLTGAREEKGRLVKTDIENAALPANSLNRHISKNKEEIETISVCSGVDRIRAVARYYDMSPDVVSKWFATLEVHLCNGCGEYRRFHRKNGSDGQMWQTLCIECQKKRRKK